MAGFSGSRAAGDERGPGVAIARQPPSRRLLACAAHFVSQKSIRPYGDVGVLMIRMRKTSVRVSSGERETSRLPTSPGTPRPALLQTFEDYHFFALVASSTRYTSPRKFTSEWFDSDISHVRDVE